VGSIMQYTNDGMSRPMTLVNEHLKSRIAPLFLMTLSRIVSFLPSYLWTVDLGPVPSVFCFTIYQDSKSI